MLSMEYCKDSQINVYIVIIKWKFYSFFACRLGDFFFLGGGGCVVVEEKERVFYSQIEHLNI